MPRKQKQCVWKQSDEYEYEQSFSTSCGEEVHMEEGTPKENGYKFCSFCGKPVVEELVSEANPRPTEAKREKESV